MSPSSRSRAATSSPTPDRARSKRRSPRCLTPSSTSPASATGRRIPSAAMPHETGNVSASLEARILVKLAGGAGIRCLVDTGFTGALVLPRDFITNNALRVIARVRFTTVEEHEIEADIAVAEVEWLGETRDPEGDCERRGRGDDRDGDAY